MLEMKVPGSTPNQRTATSHAPAMPTQVYKIQSNGTVSTAASKRGDSRYCTGLTAIVTSASICSVMRMLPSSAAVALPARAATINAANTGAISRVSETATT